jgi:hypothetical protein
MGSNFCRLHKNCPLCGFISCKKWIHVLFIYQGSKLTFFIWQPVGPVGFNFYWPEQSFTGPHIKRVKDYSFLTKNALPFNFSKDNTCNTKTYNEFLMNCVIQWSVCILRRFIFPICNIIMMFLKKQKRGRFTRSLRQKS